MMIGDVVVPRDGKRLLFCGSGLYTHAICMSVEPFVMVSEETDMLWTQQDRNEFIALCQAHPRIVRRCKRRMPSRWMRFKNWMRSANRKGQT